MITRLEEVTERRRLVTAVDEIAQMSAVSEDPLGPLLPGEMA